MIRSKNLTQPTEFPEFDPANYVGVYIALSSVTGSLTDEHMVEIRAIDEGFDWCTKEGY
jgi:hypothetical protein